MIYTHTPGRIALYPTHPGLHTHTRLQVGWFTWLVPAGVPSPRFPLPPHLPHLVPTPFPLTPLPLPPCPLPLPLLIGLVLEITPQLVVPVVLYVRFLLPPCLYSHCLYWDIVGTARRWCLDLDDDRHDDDDRMKQSGLDDECPI